MAEFKLVISDPKTGKSKQIDVKENAAKGLIGKKIKDTFKGEIIDLAGYEFQITGGSDSSGFPMRNDVIGQEKKKITDVNSLGIKNKRHRPNPKKKGMRTIKGMKLKKTVAGNTVYEKTAQINLKITKMGRDSIFEEPKPAEEPKAEEVKTEAPKVVQDAKQPESSSPEAKSEEKKKEPKTESPKEEPKPEAPKEDKKMDDKKEVVENEEETSEGEVSEGHINPDGEDVGGAADAMSAPDKKEEAKPKDPEEVQDAKQPENSSPEASSESKPEEPAKDDDSVDVEKETEDIEKEIAKDEEEVKKEDEEIDKIEKELKEGDSEVKTEEEPDKKEE